MVRTHVIAFASTLGLVTASSAFAAAAPGGAHPRLWIGQETLARMKAKVGVQGSAAAAVVTACDHLLLPEKANELKQAGDQGYNWSYDAATCALAYRLTGASKYATPAVTLFRALLDDYVTLGDGAGGDGVVQHDTGYGMRFFGAYAALMYDWLHDAPGVDAALLTHARARFKAWTDWYGQSGYLNTMPGSNYHAGYVFAKTLIAVAEGGEDGATSDAYWADVTTNLFPKQLVADGLSSKGALAGGDWPEGWEYGAAGVMEYALAARALEEQGVSFPEVRAWASSVTVRFLHGVNPAKTGMYVGGDLDDVTVDAAISARPLIATLVGPSSDEAAGWAQAAKEKTATARDICPIYDALAEARGAVAEDFAGTAPPKAYLATGTRNFYVRSSWDPGAVQAVFTSAPRLVPDHQHFDASNFTLTRGDDHLVVDPSPYGSRSALSSNAITVDSKVVEPSYAPSQSPYGAAELPWARATVDGVAAARGEIEGAFQGEKGEASDVKLARRDFTFLPEGEVVTIDRVRTDDPNRKAYLRFRTPAAMTSSSGGVMRGTVGASSLAIHAVMISAGAPTTAPVSVGNCWDSSDYGVCAKARFAANEYTLTLPGPMAFAVHVMDALGASEAAADVRSIRDRAVDPEGVNDGVLGAMVTRGGVRSVVVSSAATTAQTVATLTYAAPGDTGARHVVFDAPEDESGGSTVTAVAEGTRCTLSIVAGGASPLQGHPLIFTLGPAASGCAVSGVAAAPSIVDPVTGTVPVLGEGTTAIQGASGQTTLLGGAGPAGAGENDEANGVAADSSDVRGRVGCSAAGESRPGDAVFFVAVALGTLAVARRRRAS